MDATVEHKSQPLSWTDDRVELLQNLWKQGYTARQIAEKLGGGVTRNAVIGKAHRMGLSSKPMRSKRRLGPTPGSVDRSCQWPLGNPDDDTFRFCSKKSEPGRPYCTKHCDIAYRRQLEGQASG